MISLTRSGAALIAALMMAGTARAASVGVCGGGGGSQSKTLSCPAGQYVVSLFARKGLYTDRIGIRCAGFDSAGKRGKRGAFQFAGGTGGTHALSGTCPGSRAVTGIFTKAGSYLDAISLATCERKAQGGFAETPPKGFRLFDGGGGDFCDLVCPEEEAMHRLIVRYGSWVDSIEGFCRP